MRYRPKESPVVVRLATRNPWCRNVWVHKHNPDSQKEKESHNKRQPQRREASEPT